MLTLVITSDRSLAYYWKSLQIKMIDSTTGWLEIVEIPVFDLDEVTDANSE